MVSSVSALERHYEPHSIKPGLGTLTELEEKNRRLASETKTLKEDFEKCHAKNAINVPLFTEIRSMEPKWMLKRFVCAVNGISGLEPNSAFVDSVRQVQRQTGGGDGKPLVFMCDTGGSYFPLPAFMKGKQSRSLQSLDLALQPPLSLPVEGGGVAEGGLRAWGIQECAIEGSEPDFWQEKAKAAP